MFSLTHIPFINMEGAGYDKSVGGLYDLYCSQPLGGDQDVLASFFIQSMVETV